MKSKDAKSHNIVAEKIKIAFYLKESSINKEAEKIGVESKLIRKWR